MMRNKGFTLIEMAIVITIIGLLMGGVIKGMSLIQSAKVDSTITLAQDISVAVNAFKQQYHMLPGDMSINAASPEISNISAGCNPSTSLSTTNDGLIDTSTESQCVPEVLFKAGLTKQPSFNSDYGPVKVIAASLSGVAITLGSNPFLPSIIHVVEFQNLPCDVVQAMDRKMDNDDLTGGKGIASTGACAAGSIVPFYAVAL
jgi:prepilin-type N-terminal cleavage/methylation domain-containing protein